MGKSATTVQWLDAGSHPGLDIGETGVLECRVPLDPKQGEREYFARIGAAGIEHSTRKPFGDEFCAVNLSNLDALFHLLEQPPARLIEFGCGVGWLALLLAQRGYQVTGLDISPEAIAAAQAQLQAAQETRKAPAIVADAKHRPVRLKGSGRLRPDPGASRFSAAEAPSTSGSCRPRPRPGCWRTHTRHRWR